MSRPAWTPGEWDRAPESIAPLLPSDEDHVCATHASGSGIPGKTEFPRDWDRDRVLAAIGLTRRSPDREPKVRGEKVAYLRWIDGVEIVVHERHYPEDDVTIFWTGFPAKGPLVHRNPRR